MAARHLVAERSDLTPQAMIVKLRGRRIQGRVLAGSLFGALIVVSVALAWLVLA